MICSFLLNPETNKLFPLAGLVRIQNAAAESEDDKEKPAISGRSSPKQISRKRSGIDSLLESPLKKKSPAIELQHMKAEPLASINLKDKVDIRVIK